jgi:hypothetical protein
MIFSNPIFGKSQNTNNSDEIIKSFSYNNLGKCLNYYPYFKDRNVSFNDDFVSGQSFLTYKVKVDMFEIKKLYS